jgi:stalled ribosome alternative rescue factor ArfA
MSNSHEKRGKGSYLRCNAKGKRQFYRESFTETNSEKN